MLPSTQVACPYCGESIELLVDDSAGAQQYIEDCHVCCRPIVVTVVVDDDIDADGSDGGDDESGGAWRVVVAAEDEA